MLPAHRILYGLVSLAVTLLSFSSSSAQILQGGSIELKGSGTYQGDSVRREEEAEEVTIGTGTTQNVTLSLPAGTLQGEYDRSSEPYQFTTQAEGIVSFDNQIFSLNASASIQLNGDARYAIFSNQDQIPRSEANLTGFFLSDGITLYSSDPSHWGQQALADVSVDVTAALSSSLTNSAQDRSLAIASYYVLSAPTGGLAGVVKRETPDGEFSSESSGDFNLATPTTATRQDYPMWIASGLPPQVGGNLVVIDTVIRTTAQVAADSGGSASANATVTLRNPRIGNVRLASDGTAIADELLTSISQSGYDWLGNGEPVITPDEYRWTNQDGGSFSTDANWESGQVPGDEDRAIFDLPGAYVVSVGTQDIQSLRIGGNPTLDLEFIESFLTVNSNALVPPGIAIDTGEFSLLGGRIDSTHTVIGGAGDTISNVRGGTTRWINTGRLTVGGSGETRFFITNGGSVNSGETWIGFHNEDISRIVEIIARGESSVFDMGNAQISGEDGSFVQARDGGFLRGGIVRVGITSGDLGSIGSVGKDESTDAKSLVEIDLLQIGYGGEGSFAVFGGGEAEISTLIVGQSKKGIVGIFDPESHLQVFNTLSVGGSPLSGEGFPLDASAEGELNVFDGGSVEVGTEENPTSTLVIGSTGRGIIGVGVANDESQSKLKSHGTLYVGWEGGRPEPDYDGILRIEHGSSVEADNIVVAPNNNSSGFIELFGESENQIGKSSHLSVSKSLIIGGDNGTLEPRNAQAKMSIRDGALVEVLDELIIGNTSDAGVTISGVLPSNPSIASTIEAHIVTVGRGALGALWVVDRAELWTDAIQIGVPIENFSYEETVNTGLFVERGGRVFTELLDARTLFDGDLPLHKSVITVEGSNEESASRLTTSQLYLGFGDELYISNGGRIDSSNVEIQSGATVTVHESSETFRSTWTIENDLILGGEEGVESFFKVDDNALVDVQGNIDFHQYSKMCIDGELRSNEIFMPGYLQLGCSLGVALIDGNFTLGPTGVLEIEIWGSTPVDEHDTMIVTGDVDLQGTLHFVFKDYAPQQGEIFAILDAAGSFSDTGSSLLYSGLKEGFEARYESVDGTMSLVAESDAELLDANDPVIYNATLLGENGRANFTLFGETGYRYLFEFSTDLEEWVSLEEVEGSNAVLYFDHGGSGTKRQFYRVRRSAL